MTGNTIYFVADRAYCLWANNVSQKNADFLRDMDPRRYGRLARTQSRRNLENEKVRREVSPLIRLFWHHAVETLITMAGASIQSPEVVFGYFSDCKNDDVRLIGKRLLDGDPLGLARIELIESTLLGYLKAVFSFTKWAPEVETVNFIEKSLRHIVGSYLEDHHRLEFNAIKHGLRLTTGTTSIRMTEEKEGAQSFGFEARDSSNFLAVVPLEGLAGAQKRANRHMVNMTSGWSLNRSIIDLHLISMMIENIRSFIRCLNGDNPKEQRFFRPNQDKEWQQRYLSDHPQLGSLAFREGHTQPSVYPTSDEIIDYWRRSIPVTPSVR